MSDRALLDKMTRKMDGGLEHLKKELSGLRGSRASLSLLDHVTVTYYGTPTPLKQVSTISIPESRSFMIQPWDPSSIPDIEKAIHASDLGLNPSNDGKVIRIPIPALSEERRKQLVKICRKYGEDSKIKIRGIRRETNDELKRLLKSSTLTEDDVRRSEAAVQKITDSKIQQADELLQKKEEEILEI
ncbi:MAG: ribosome recycling factor [Nitrospira sp.]|nr:ribosome recycling factor [Nitrospira sp.]MDD9859517.1 ribosome recycling factor [Nitrospira sp.]